MHIDTAHLLESLPLQLHPELALELWIHPESDCAWAQVAYEDHQIASHIELRDLWAGLMANNLIILCGGETESDVFTVAATSQDIKAIKHAINANPILKDTINEELSRTDRQPHQVRRLEVNPRPHGEGSPPRRPAGGAEPGMADSPFSFERPDSGEET